MQSLLIPQPDRLSRFSAPISAQNSIDKPYGFTLHSRFPSGDLDAAREALSLKRAGWAALDLRQQFNDEAWMRCHLKAAGIRAPIVVEPATVTRLRSCLKRAGVQDVEILDSLGTTLTGYLKLNPSLPLWAALALVLEATGRFTAKVHDISGATSPATPATAV